MARTTLTKAQGDTTPRPTTPPPAPKVAPDYLKDNLADPLPRDAVLADEAAAAAVASRVYRHNIMDWAVTHEQTRELRSTEQVESSGQQHTVTSASQFSGGNITGSHSHTLEQLHDDGGSTRVRAGVRRDRFGSVGEIGTQRLTGNGQEAKGGTAYLGTSPTGALRGGGRLDRTSADGTRQSAGMEFNSNGDQIFTASRAKDPHHSDSAKMVLHNSDGQIDSAAIALNRTRGANQMGGSASLTVNGVGEVVQRPDGLFAVTVSSGGGVGGHLARSDGRDHRAARLSAGAATGQSRTLVFKTRKEAEQAKKSGELSSAVRSASDLKVGEAMSVFDQVQAGVGGDMTGGGLEASVEVSHSQTSSWHLNHVSEHIYRLTRDQTSRDGGGITAGTAGGSAGLHHSERDSSGEIYEIDDSTPEGADALQKFIDTHSAPIGHSGLHQIGDSHGHGEDDKRSANLLVLAAGAHDESSVDTTTIQGHTRRDIHGSRGASASLLGEHHGYTDGIDIVEQDGKAVAVRFSADIDSSSGDDAKTALARAIGTQRSIAPVDDIGDRQWSVSADLSPAAVEAYLDKMATGTMGKDVFLDSDLSAADEIEDFKRQLEAIQVFEDGWHKDFSTQKYIALSKFVREAGPAAIHHIRKYAGSDGSAMTVSLKDDTFLTPHWRHKLEGRLNRLDKRAESLDPDDLNSTLSTLRGVQRSLGERIKATEGSAGAKRYPELPEQERSFQVSEARRLLKRANQIVTKVKAALVKAEAEQRRIDEMIDANDPLNFQPEALGPLKP